MNTALAILAHALRMLLFDVPTTIRVLLPAMGIVMGCSLAIAMLSPDALLLITGEPEAITPPPSSSLLVFFGLGIVGLLGYALMAILWHRHVLLNGAEKTEALRPDAGVFFGYIWRAIVVGILQMIAMIPVTIALGLVGMTISSNGNPSGLAGLIFAILGSVAFVWLALRLSVVLPSAAVGRGMRVMESWALTRQSGWPLLGLALLLTGLNVLITAVTGPILPSEDVLSVVVQTAIFIIEGLVFISVLTTLYGHLVEGRSLGQ
ncbi:putative membrane protein [Sulfitobacter noctilucicola]|uniref:Heme exporter protein D n=1 Tax=Sulfitobacter noctilucicola TaxID=1342301 RepID=A0A7W6M8A6_9RHOB|nr:hypothetical protein [Sulfitobacter noctilucicola]KIN64575.1 putative membrane protein [Sulfitobacter noctilucicola]MBB4174270.1 heme exporter protein D [Sulfitobacter noctilucicola]